MKWTNDTDSWRPQVAAYPATGPIDILGDGIGGMLHEDFQKATMHALDVPHGEAVAKAAAHVWNECALQFLRHLPKQSAASQARDFLPHASTEASPQ